MVDQSRPVRREWHAEAILRLLRVLQTAPAPARSPPRPGSSFRPYRRRRPCGSRARRPGRGRRPTRRGATLPSRSSSRRVTTRRHFDGQPAAVGTERTGHRPSSRDAREIVDQSTRPGVPELHPAGVAVTAGDDPAAVGTDRDGANVAVRAKPAGSARGSRSKTSPPSLYMAAASVRPFGVMSRTSRVPQEWRTCGGPTFVPPAASVTGHRSNDGSPVKTAPETSKRIRWVSPETGNVARVAPEAGPRR